MIFVAVPFIMIFCFRRYSCCCCSCYICCCFCYYFICTKQTILKIIILINPSFSWLRPQCPWFKPHPVPNSFCCLRLATDLCNFKVDCADGSDEWNCQSCRFDDAAFAHRIPGACACLCVCARVLDWVCVSVCQSVSLCQWVNASFTFLLLSQVSRN